MRPMTEQTVDALVREIDSLIAQIPTLSITDQWKHGYISACTKIKSLCAALPASPGGGWRWVPVEPTEEEVHAAQMEYLMALHPEETNFRGEGPGGRFYEAHKRAIISARAAAPTPPAEAGETKPDNFAVLSSEISRAPAREAPDVALRQRADKHRKLIREATYGKSLLVDSGLTVQEAIHLEQLIRDLLAAKERT